MEHTVKRTEVSHEYFEGPPPGPNYMVLLQHGPNPWINLHALDTRMNVIDRGEKLDVGDFNDHDSEAFFNWIHSLENFFRLMREIFFAVNEFGRINISEIHIQLVEDGKISKLQGHDILCLHIINN